MCKTKTNGTNTNCLTGPVTTAAKQCSQKENLILKATKSRKTDNTVAATQHVRNRESGRAKRARLVQSVVMATHRRAEQVARSSMWAALLRERAAFSQKATAKLC